MKNLFAIFKVSRPETFETETETRPETFETETETCKNGSQDETETKSRDSITGVLCKLKHFEKTFGGTELQGGVK